MVYHRCMIQNTSTCHCRVCDSPNIVRNGTIDAVRRSITAKTAVHIGCSNPCRLTRRYTADDPEHLQGARQPTRPRRIFGVARQTVLRWLKERVQRLPDLKDTLVSPQANDVLELDELWSFVLKKDAKRWLWLALCRRTRQVVAFVIGDRSDATCRRLWNKIPESYRACHSYSDFWAAYQKVFSRETHQSVGKESGQTAHVERWNNTLRQRLARFVRKTLSFSKSDVYHSIVAKWFIAEYNLDLSLTM